MSSPAVKILQVHPPSTIIDDLINRSAFLGISIANPSFTEHRLEALFAWAEDRFASVHVLLGDSIERHNHLWSGGLTEDEAERLALRKAAPLEAMIRNVLRRRGGPPVNLLKSADLLRWRDFKGAMSAVRLHYDSNPVFSATVMEDVEAYVSRRKQRGQSTTHDKMVLHSVNYVLEEIAMFALLVDRGIDVQLYPGRHLRVLADLSSGRLPPPLPPLARLVCVDLSIK